MALRHSCSQWQWLYLPTPPADLAFSPQTPQGMARQEQPDLGRRVQREHFNCNRATSRRLGRRRLEPRRPPRQAANERTGGTTSRRGRARACAATRDPRLFPSAHGGIEQQPRRRHRNTTHSCPAGPLKSSPSTSRRRRPACGTHAGPSHTAASSAPRLPHSPSADPATSILASRPRRQIPARSSAPTTTWPQGQRRRDCREGRARDGTREEAKGAS